MTRRKFARTHKIRSRDLLKLRHLEKIRFQAVSQVLRGVLFPISELRTLKQMSRFQVSLSYSHRGPHSVGYFYEDTSLTGKPYSDEK